MIVKEINNFEIKYFKVERGEEELPFNETECFEYYRNIGYKVYFGYGHVAGWRVFAAHRSGWQAD